MCQVMNISGRTSRGKLSLCPKKREGSSLEAWIEEVKMWDECNKEESVVQKYLNFIDSIRTSEKCDELKMFVEVNIVENKMINKEEDNTIKEVLRIIEGSLCKSDLEKSTSEWTRFADIMQKEGENVRDFVIRYEQSVTGLKNVGIILSQKVLAIHLITKSNLAESSKENIVTKVNTDDHENLYNAVAKAMRELKTLTSSATISENVNEIHYSENHSRRKMFRNSEGRQKRGRSQTLFRENNRESKCRRSMSRLRGRPKGNWDREHTSRKSKSRYTYENNHFNTHRRRSRSRSRHRQKRYREHRSKRSESRHRSRIEQSNNNIRISRRNTCEGFHQRKSSHKAQTDSTSGSEGHCISSDKLNEVHYSSYDDNLEQIKSIIAADCDDDNDESLNKDFILAVYKEGNNDISPNHCIVDTACPKTVAGVKWLDSHSESNGRDYNLIRRKAENEKFKFGPSDVYVSKYKYEIKVKIGRLEEFINVSIVEADIPLLLGMDYQNKWGMILDTGRKQIFIEKTQETFNVDTSRTNHWKLPIRPGKTAHDEARHVVFKTDLSEINNRKLLELCKDLCMPNTHKEEQVDSIPMHSHIHLILN